TQGPNDSTAVGGAVGGSGAPASMTLSNAHAHADDNTAYTDALVTGYDSSSPGASFSASSFAFRQQVATIVQGPLAAATVQPSAGDSVIAHVDSAEAHTRQAFEGNTLVVTASTKLKGVRLLGDNVHVDSIETTSLSKSDG